MVQTKLSIRPSRRVVAIDSDNDVVMSDSNTTGETSSKSLRQARQRRAVVVDSDDDDQENDEDEDEDEEVAEVTKGTRLMMVAVEVPVRQANTSQTKINQFFAPRSSNAALSSTSSAKAKSKQKIATSSSKPATFQRRISRKKRDFDDDDADDYVPENKSDIESDYHSEVVPESEEDNEEIAEDEEEDMVPRKGKNVMKAPVGKNIKAKRESFKSTPKACGIKIEPRNYEQEGGLAPISNLALIFDDIVSRVLPSIKKLMGPNKYRKLRVATMCSGTESPLLALGMFSKAIKGRGLGNLEIDHVFSCEIEPYKQAYIERNFKPPILFRDIKELGHDEATTAYGAKVPVPGDVDILIAGTSCVDFSGLNNKQKSLEDGGESGDTFLGMMAWVTKHRPLIVIQENVSSAAWAEMRRYYRDRGYAAEFTRFDSKYYYIPHTRQRGYLLAVNIEGSDIPNKWIDAVKQLRRNCTTTLEAFMLPDDDPRVYKARMELIGDPRRTGPIKARTVDWEKCEGRHQRERIMKKLGEQRPVTSWQEGGVCKVLDFMWQDWGRKQVERVLDLMDINFLLSVKDGYDPMYKAAFWNLSQNVDRNTMGGKPEGICPCLTPHMIAYLCYRGGPMTGIEALHMQGLPIDELLLTRETSQQIQDLAGNAMSSTVVGTTMLAALILAMDHLEDRSGDDKMEVDETDIESHIIGDEDLQQHPLDLFTTVALDLETLLVEAERSSRLCICEGRFSITSNKIRLCTECGFTACDHCGGRPSHVVPESQQNPQFENRLLPLEFESKLKSILSMRLRLDGIDMPVLEALKTNNGALMDDIKKSDWSIWSQLVLDAVKGEFRFKTLLRQEKWTVTYDAPGAKLELVLDPKRPEWRVFAKCPEMEGRDSRIRAMCQPAIARMFIEPGKSALAGQWELCLPTVSKLNITVEGIGDKVPSWQQTLGYTDSQTLKSEVWNGLRMIVPDEEKAKLDRDISGEYRLLPTCGTAQGALHIKENNSGDTPLYFFLDQKRTGGAEDDSFTFSDSHRRLGFGEVRTMVAKLVPKWRQSTVDGPESVKCIVNGHWVAVNAQIGPPPISASKDGTVSIPGPKGFNISCTNDDCKSAHTVLICKVPLREQAESVWPQGNWIEVDSVHERLTYESLAWLTERVRSLKQLTEWSNLELPSTGVDNCERCAPTPPQLKWFLVKNKFKAFEDPQEAAPYERALKKRPNPFVTHIKLDEAHIGTLKIGLNVPTLVHRALSRLPAEGNDQNFVLSWRLVTDYISEPLVLLPFYNLTSNKHDPPSVQPPNFIKKLRPEQLRSLHWMKDQEKEDVAPFMEEEVAEALLPHLNWRAEGKAERPNHVRGGVLADEVGYGKTAITIGLIDSTQASINLPEKMPGAIPVKATLIVVPQHLGDQWVSEIAKFTGGKYKVIYIHSQTGINTLSVKDVIKADIIVVMGSLFRSTRYLENLAHFACTKTPPSGEGRRFFDWQRTALAALAKQVDNIRENGAQAARARIDEEGRELERDEASATFIQRKRLVGSAYTQSKEKTGGKRSREDSEEGSLSDAESDSSGSDRAKKTRQSRVDQDPWNLRSKRTHYDWTEMTAPSFEMFHFNRLVVDEFTYLTGQIHAGITSQKANSRWVLSGTPPLDDFADVKTIAVYLNIHLGIDDDQVGKQENRKKMRKDRTGVEQFTAFRQVHSPYWHSRRQEIAQAFLNKYVRQNYAEIEEIPFEEHIVPVELPAAERAIYLELEHYLQALDYNVMKSKAKVDNDRDRRQQEALGDSKTAEEALIKRCSHFDLVPERPEEENAVRACDFIVSDRKKQLFSCREDIRRSLRDAYKRYKSIPSKEWQEKGRSSANDKRPRDLFAEFVDQCHTVGVGDPDANHDIGVLLDEAMGKGGLSGVVYADGSIAGEITDAPEPVADTKVKRKGKGKAKKEKESSPEPWPMDTFEKINQLKNKVVYLRGLVRKELAGRHRSLRYFMVVRDLQKSDIVKDAATNVNCPGCHKKNLKPNEIAVLSSCGHQGCYDCLEKAARLTKCLTENCQAATRALAVVRADSLGSEEKRHGIGRHYGEKLEKIVKLIMERIPEEEKVLLFVQFPDLTEKVIKILDANKIKYCKIHGTGKQQSTIVKGFQKEDNDIKVMLLNVMAESASGANLTNANHAIILSPLLTDTDYLYKSSETQAIGRIRRYGQTRTVHIWRFMSENTMDVEIYEKRTGEKRNSAEFNSKVYKL